MQKLVEDLLTTALGAMRVILTAMTVMFLLAGDPLLMIWAAVGTSVADQFVRRRTPVRITIIDERECVVEVEHGAIPDVLPFVGRNHLFETRV